MNDIGIISPVSDAKNFVSALLWDFFAKKSTIEVAINSNVNLLTSIISKFSHADNLQPINNDIEFIVKKANKAGILFFLREQEQQVRLLGKTIENVDRYSVLIFRKAIAFIFAMEYTEDSEKLNNQKSFFLRFMQSANEINSNYKIIVAVVKNSEMNENALLTWVQSEYPEISNTRRVIGIVPFYLVRSKSQPSLWFPIGPFEICYHLGKIINFDFDGESYVKVALEMKTKQEITQKLKEIDSIVKEIYRTKPNVERMYGEIYKKSRNKPFEVLVVLYRMGNYLEAREKTIIWPKAQEICNLMAHNAKEFKILQEKFIMPQQDKIDENRIAFTFLQGKLFVEETSQCRLAIKNKNNLQAKITIKNVIANNSEIEIEKHEIEIGPTKDDEVDVFITPKKVGKIMVKFEGVIKGENVEKAFEKIFLVTAEKKHEVPVQVDTVPQTTMPVQSMNPPVNPKPEVNQNVSKLIEEGEIKDWVEVINVAFQKRIKIQFPNGEDYSNKNGYINLLKTGLCAPDVMEPRIYNNIITDGKNGKYYFAGDSLIVRAFPFLTELGVKKRIEINPNNSDKGYINISLNLITGLAANEKAKEWKIKIGYKEYKCEKKLETTKDNRDILVYTLSVVQ
ncbi:MAG: hypothetical protein ACP5UL_05190 [Thermoplasmata archaeon]